MNNQINEHNVPSEQDLRNLPLRALVAFAARCARRIYPQFLLPSSLPQAQQFISAVDKAITLAEAYAKNEPVSSKNAHVTGAEAASVAQSLQKLPIDFQMVLVANSAAEAAYAVYSAASELGESNAIVTKAFMLTDGADMKSIGNTLAEVRGLHTANFAVRASVFAAHAAPLSTLHISHDFAKLASLALGAYPDLGDPIDTDNTGPLGPLWLNDEPRWFAVDEQHPFYEEILQFKVSAISLEALLMASLIQKGASGGIAQNINIVPPEQVPLIELPDLRLEMHLAETGCMEECIVSTVATVEYLVGVKGRPVQLLFALRPWNGHMPDESTISGKLDAHIGPSLETVVCYLVGGAFERFKDHFRATYGNDDRRWPPELQFFRHLRNGCFHQNKFNMLKRRDGSAQIDPSNPPKWHSYIMTSDNLLAGHKVIDGFFHIPHVLPLLHNMGNFV